LAHRRPDDDASMGDVIDTALKLTNEISNLPPRAALHGVHLILGGRGAELLKHEFRKSVADFRVHGVKLFACNSDGAHRLCLEGSGRR
jgi:hypothetical protein